MSDTNRKLIEDVLGPDTAQWMMQGQDQAWLVRTAPSMVHEYVRTVLKQASRDLPTGGAADWEPGTMVRWAEGHRAGPQAAMWFVRRLNGADPLDAEVVKDMMQGGFSTIRALPYPDALLVMPDKDGDLNAYILTSYARLAPVVDPNEREELVEALQGYAMEDHS